VSKTVVLVLLKPDDADAKPFRDIIEHDADLRDRIDLRFADTESAQDVIADVNVVVCGNLSPELLDKATALRWIAFWSAGMDGKFTPQLQARNLMLTNASGVHGPNIAEHVMMFMLMFTRNETFYFRSQIAREWKRDNWGQEKWNRQPRRSAASELSGQTLGIVGLGRIGEALAKRARAFDMRVIATKRDPATRYDPSITLDAVYGMDELPRLLAHSDHVCVTVPYTPDTHHLLNAAMLSQMQPTAYLYNIGRGKLIDEAALIEALQNGRLAGAGLDVFETEPLPAESPLWDLDNVILTPHVSGITPFYFQRMAQLLADNLHHFLANKPLHNLYNPDRGY
jgi:D-2-hydroxyacid dehydrogenase (NADP+)